MTRPGSMISGCIAGQDVRAFLPESVLAGEHGITRRRASRRGRMGIGEAESFAGEAVDVRRADFGGAVAADVAVAQIVGVNQDDVGTIGPDSQRRYKHQ